MKPDLAAVGMRKQVPMTAAAPAQQKPGVSKLQKLSQQNQAVDPQPAVDKQKLHEAKKAAKEHAKLSQADRDIQAVLDLPDSPKVKLDRARREVAQSDKASRLETRQMIDEILLKQE